jgi:hypothetical protein
MKLEIDYSEVPQINVPTQSEEWEPPVHKFFGKKLPNGKMEKEPIYVHQEYPRLMYALRNGKLTAKIVHSDAELISLGSDWAKNPSAFGYIGAPSFEQALELKAAEAAQQKTKEEEAQDVVDMVVETLQTTPKRGRPAKA